MIHSLSMFLAPDSTVAQATLVSPPALEQPVQSEAGKKGTSIKFMAGIVGNAIGFGALLTGCWFTLQLMQVVL